MVICDSDGVTGDCILHQYEQYKFFQKKLLANFFYTEF
jgi:hypothetical protein